MKRRNPSIILIFCLFLLCIGAFVSDVQAHVSADNMPDAVAEIEYRIFLEFTPDDTKVLNKLGMVYYRQKKLPKAFDTFSKVLSIEPENFDALDGMGLVKAAQQDYDEAISYHRKAIAINVDDMAGYFHLGSILEIQGMIAEALAAYRTALVKFNEQYPDGSGSKKIVAFGKDMAEAVERLEVKSEKWKGQV